MSKHKDTFFMAKVVEVILDEGVPTLELRIRIPTLHGSSTAGVADADLPKAKPMLIPGTIVDPDHFDTTIVGEIVYIILEGGDVTRPLYFGLRGSAADYIKVNDVVPVIPYAGPVVPGIVRVVKDGTTGYIYTSDPE